MQSMNLAATSQQESTLWEVARVHINPVSQLAAAATVSFIHLFLSHIIHFSIYFQKRNLVLRKVK